MADSLGQVGLIAIGFLMYCLLRSEFSFTSEIIFTGSLFSCLLQQCKDPLPLSSCFYCSDDNCVYREMLSAFVSSHFLGGKLATGHESCSVTSRALHSFIHLYSAYRYYFLLYTYLFCQLILMALDGICLS